MNEFTIDASPRGCGSLQEEAYYLNSGPGSPYGTLSLLTYTFGNGLDDVVFADRVPARGVVEIDPAATFAAGSIVMKDELIPESALYRHLRMKVTSEGLADHIGSQHYTPYSFWREVLHRGANRRVPRSVAARIASRLPIPLICTHADIPVFRTLDQVGYAYRLALSVLNDPYEHESVAWMANWRRASWGFYVSDHDGSDNPYRVILKALDRLQNLSDYDRESGEFDEALEFFAEVDRAEQPFVATWITRSIWIKPDDKEPSDEDLQAGITPAVPYVPQAGEGVTA